MEYIEGRLVSDIWDDLDINAHHDLLCQLYKYIRELQGIKLSCPGPIGGGISQGSFFTDYITTPFTSRVIWRSGLTAVFLFAMTSVMLAKRRLGGSLTSSTN